MLTGKENFNIALKYFLRAKFVKIKRDGITIGLAGEKDENFYRMNYSFPLLKTILNCACVEELYLEDIPPIVDELNLFDYLITENLKEVETTRESLPLRYEKLLKPFKNIRRIEYYTNPSPNYPDLSNASSFCREIRIKDYYLVKLFQNNLSNFNLPPLDTIRIDGNLWGFNFTIDKFTNLVHFISKSFPNLQFLHVFIRLDGLWSEINDTIFDIEPAIFNAIPPNVDGKIGLYRKSKDDESFEDAALEVENKPYMILDDQKQAIRKDFQINDRLNFKFWYEFGCTNEEVRLTDFMD